MSQMTRRDKLIPWYFVAFFIVLFAVNAVFVTVAFQSYTGVVTDNHYEEGLAYNDNLEQRRKQKSLNWQSEFFLSADGITINFSLKNEYGKPIENANVTAYAMRPVQEGDDFSLKLEENKAGFYSQKINFPVAGQWQIRVEVISDKNEQYQLTKRFIVENQ